MILSLQVLYLPINKFSVYIAYGPKKMQPKNDKMADIKKIIKS